ncbi:ANTAR domain-containing protein [Streptomyces antibioticus]|uniref:ANTAR domain-containing protein n=1 Tax=Streptomyces antibioticus TaxID=1890 RepID=UPI003D7080C2
MNDARAEPNAEPNDEPNDGTSDGTSDGTDDESARIVELEEEAEQLEAAVSSHAVVDQAIGMTVALGRVSPDQGRDVLEAVSQHIGVTYWRAFSFSRRVVPPAGSTHP